MTFKANYNGYETKFKEKEKFFLIFFYKMLDNRKKQCYIFQTSKNLFLQKTGIIVVKYK